MTRYLDDFAPGDRYRLADLELTEQEIVRFAERYDPQSFHVDPVRAADGPFGGLVASGLQSVCELVGRWVEGVMVSAAGLGSPAIGGISFLHPVRPGCRYRATAEVVSARRSRDRDDRGVLEVALALHEGDRTVLVVRPIVLVAVAPRRDVEAPATVEEEHVRCR